MKTELEVLDDRITEALRILQLCRAFVLANCYDGKAVGLVLVHEIDKYDTMIVNDRTKMP